MSQTRRYENMRLPFENRSEEKEAIAEGIQTRFTRCRRSLIEGNLADIHAAYKVLRKLRECKTISVALEEAYRKASGARKKLISSTIASWRTSIAN